MADPIVSSQRAAIALLQARDLLQALSNPRRTPRLTRDLRAQARAALLHYPSEERLITCAHPPGSVGDG
jgi:hypothetical protein